MILKTQELRQMDSKFVRNLLISNPDALVDLCVQIINDLKESLERLNQNSNNSSVPSGSLAPWDKGTSKNTSDVDEDNNTDGTEKEDGSSTQDTDTKESNTEDNTKLSDDKNITDQENSPQKKRKAGKQQGSQGFGRTQKLKVTVVEEHHCDCCSACNTDLTPVEKAYTGFYTVNIEYGDVDAPGIQLTNTKHLYYKAKCPNCGLESHSEPIRAAENNLDWQDVGMTEWRLIGPDLASMIVYCSTEMRLTRRKIQLFLYDIFGLQLCVGSLQNCIIESARALAPVEEEIVKDLLSENKEDSKAPIYIDETSHKEAGKLLWLWVFITATTALFLIGYRSKEIFNNLLDSYTPRFTGWIMTDGYCVYRDYLNRLRCWAHLTRKARGLCESYTENVRSYGKQVKDILDSLMNAIYKARESPDKGTVSISADYKNELEQLKIICQEMSKSSHTKTRELGVEFLNDWAAIFRVLEYPAWPLTNNEAERALRHWVIMRRITQGTRSEQGSRALALFASVIATCRLRNSSPLLYIRDVIKSRRQGENVPKLPPVIERNIIN